DWDCGNAKEMTQAFCQLISGQLVTQNELLGLFSPTMNNISMWILLINLFENPKEWEKFGINPEFLTQPYLSYYQHINTHHSLLEGKSIAQKIIMLHALAEDPFSEVENIAEDVYFSRSGKKGKKAIIIKTDNPTVQISHALALAKAQ